MASTAAMLASSHLGIGAPAHAAAGSASAGVGPSAPGPSAPRLVTAQIPGLITGAVSGLPLDATLHRAAAALGSAIETVPWARALALATHQPNVLIAPLSRTAQREALGFHWLLHLRDLRFAFATVGRPAPAGLAEAASVGRIAVWFDTAQEAMLREGGLGPRLDPGDDLDSVRKLAGGRVEAWFSSIEEMGRSWAALGDPRPLTIGPPIRVQPIWLAASPPTPADRVQEMRQRLVAVFGTSPVAPSAPKL